VLLNLSFIGMALFAAPWFDPPYSPLAWRLFLGGALQTGNPASALAQDRHAAALRTHCGATRECNAVLKSWPPLYWRFRFADQPVDQHHLRLIPSERQRLMALIMADTDDGVSLPGLLGAALGTICCPAGQDHASGRTEDFSGLLDWACA